MTNIKLGKGQSSKNASAEKGLIAFPRRGKVCVCRGGVHVCAHVYNLKVTSSGESPLKLSLMARVWSTHKPQGTWIQWVNLLQNY